jgi:hypothetical protein
MAAMTSHANGEYLYTQYIRHLYRFFSSMAWFSGDAHKFQPVDLMNVFIRNPARLIPGMLIQ